MNLYSEKSEIEREQMRINNGVNRYPYFLLLPLILILGAIIFYPIGYAIFLVLIIMYLPVLMKLAFLD